MTSPTAAGSGRTVLTVENLAVQFPSSDGWLTVVRDVAFTVGAGQTVGLVGESGSGKTVTSLAVMGLTKYAHGRISSGRVDLSGTDLLACSDRQLASIRGERIGMVFQQAIRSLDPAFTVGEQIAEVLRRHKGMKRKLAWAEAVKALERVHIPNAAERAKDYPHQFSGGMSQRVMIAMALACSPEMLIADEPTTALDVTVQAKILELLQEVQADTGVSILFVSHDMGVIAEMCDWVVVMYAGEVVEQGRALDVFRTPHHPYAAGLLASIPRSGQSRLPAIAGNVPVAAAFPRGCRFHPRCSFMVSGACDDAAIEVIEVGGSEVRCVRAGELTLPGVVG